MKVLVDTHIILWALTGDDNLSKEARGILTDPANALYCSVASAWEVTIKHMMRPDKMLMAGSELLRNVRLAGFTILPIKSDHVTALETLSRSENAPPHKDPFDRMLIAQAKAENMVFITHDSLIPQYNEACVLPV